MRITLPACPRRYINLRQGNRGVEYVLSYRVDFDRDINKDLRERIKGHASVEFRDGTLTLDEALKLYASAGVVISNRLHVLLVAILAGSIPVALTDLETHAKITDLFRDNGLDEYLVD